MTLQDLIADLRQLREREFDNGWKPSGKAIVEMCPHGGEDTYSGPSYNVGKLLRNAYLGGVFKLEYFNDLRSALTGADVHKAAAATMYFLRDKGFQVFGNDPKVDSIERVILALEEIDRIIATPERTVANGVGPAQPQRRYVWSPRTYTTPFGSDFKMALSMSLISPIGLLRDGHEIGFDALSNCKKWAGIDRPEDNHDDFLALWIDENKKPRWLNVLLTKTPKTTLFGQADNIEEGSNVIEIDMERAAIWFDYQEYELPIDYTRMKGSTAGKSGSSIFIGHGGASRVWKDLRELLEKRMGLKVEEFNTVPVAGKSNKERLQELLDNCTFAFLVMTAEDELKNGNTFARQNVVHEVGLFQGRKGWERAIILLEDGCAEFSNSQGIGHIPFPKGNIESVSEKIRAVLEREKIL